MQLTNTCAPVVAKLKTSLALAAVATGKVQTLRMIATRAQTLSALIYVCIKERWRENETVSL